MSGSLQVWTCELPSSPDVLARCAASLSADERQRAARLRFERDRERYIAAHAALRTILGRVSGTAPEALRFCPSEHGKPRLDGATASELEFNLSHSGDLALVGTASGTPVGVDIERSRPLPDAAALAERILSPAELGESLSPRADPGSDFLLGVWVRKEAVLKALGTGLSVDPRDLTLTPTRAAGVWQARLAGTDWSVYELAAAEGYHAAVAARGAGWRVLSSRLTI